MRYFVCSREKIGLPRKIAICQLKSIGIGTLQAYCRVWRQFANWFNKGSSSSGSLSINTICEFLLYLFELQCSHSALNIARSALSYFLDHELKIGTDTNIHRLFKFFWKARPARARYFVNWDVGKLLTLLQSWHPLSSLNLEKPTLKNLALMAVYSSDRGQILEAIDIEHSLDTPHNAPFPFKKN